MRTSTEWYAVKRFVEHKYNLYVSDALTTMRHSMRNWVSDILECIFLYTEGRLAKNKLYHRVEDIVSQITMNHTKGEFIKDYCRVTHFIRFLDPDCFWMMELMLSCRNRAGKPLSHHQLAKEYRSIPDYTNIKRGWWQ